MAEKKEDVKQEETPEEEKETKKSKKEPKKEKATKEEKKEQPRAPQKDKDPKPTKRAVVEPMAHIDDYLGVASSIYDLNNMQQAGFKSYMRGKHYLSDLEAFEPYLNKYLGN